LWCGTYIQLKNERGKKKQHKEGWNKKKKKQEKKKEKTRTSVRFESSKIFEE
jgi:hypothetical protein